MKLSWQVSREYKGKEYKRFWIVIPTKIIEKLGWKGDEDLEADIKGKKLVIEKD